MIEIPVEEGQTAPQILEAAQNHPGIEWDMDRDDDKSDIQHIELIEEDDEGNELSVTTPFEAW